MADKACVMLVDDDRSFLRTLGDFLEFEGFDVVACKSGEDALERLEKTTPGVILLDVNMPGMGGIGFLRRLLQPDGTLRYPVIMLTARTETERFFADVAVDAFLPKPCDADAVADAVRQVLAKQRAGATPEAPETGTEATSAIRVLLGEDDARVVARMRDRFSGAGYAVTVVQSGPELIEEAPRLRPDLIVLKEVLPGMNGSTVASLIHVMPSTQDLPIVLYDETRSDGDFRKYHFETPGGVSAYLLTSESGAVLAAAREIIARRQPPSP